MVSKTAPQQHEQHLLLNVAVHPVRECVNEHPRECREEWFIVHHLAFRAPLVHDLADVAAAEQGGHSHKRAAAGAGNSRL